MDSDEHRPVARLAATLERFMREWNDTMQPAPGYLNWFQGRHMGNTFGALGDPLAEPDWSLL